MPGQLDLARRLDVATEAARAAGAVLQQLQGNLQDIREKRPGDLVTEADRAAELTVLEIVQRHFPADSILAEESGQQGNGAATGFLWAIDPLDGTTNYAHGYPAAAVSIGLLQAGEPVLGVVYDVFRNELFRAATGMGATCNYLPICVSSTDRLENSLLVTGFAYDRRETADNNYAEFCHFTHLTQGVRRGGSASVDLAAVAMGRLDGYWERGLSVWDIAAGIVLVREAGGSVTAYDGSPLLIESGRLLASNGSLHAAMQLELSRVQPLQQALPTHPTQFTSV
ncbi:inositol monophosphatase family protein [Synechococcus sp. PCC 7336]|uniref:inositol monophosphatase family protein n=1 Tax=Synechococcus sp. PCC 7336 TaxID=195250 RepID=UPI0004768508|nr:inositol monophosphatase family protein [Synechococcus sp. PCC 7336]